MLLHWTGRFGNRMFLYSFGCQYAKKYNCKFYIPSEWEGSTLFVKNKYVDVIPDDELRLHINQTHPDMDTKEYRKYALENYVKRTGDNVEYVQTNKEMMGKTNIAFDDLHCMYFPDLFKIMETRFVKSIFEFNDNVKNSQLWKNLSQHKGKYDAVHWRRGDIASPGYKGAHSMITQKCITDAIEKYGDPSALIVWVSDDNAYRTREYLNVNIVEWNNKARGKSAWHYPVGENVIPEIFYDFFPEFLVLYFSRRLFRGNSSYSWWASVLSGAETYCPIITSKPNGKRNVYHVMEAEYEPGNDQHWMGSDKEGFHKIIYGS
tara:strand:+ start:4255 stop:5211 length:957 start_codon:yes stop_codon:yes gene_type:complete